VISELDMASHTELDSMKSNALYINDKLITFFKTLKLDLIDFKLEFGIRKKDTHLVLADEICPDTMRLWDEQGNSFDKDLFRENTGDLLEGYKRVETLLRNEIGC
jgi:phosphoribosylaminoimidazole-succinocarboxamide synthase